jgi:hypothetical protein
VAFFAGAVFLAGAAFFADFDLAGSAWAAGMTRNDDITSAPIKMVRFEAIRRAHSNRQSIERKPVIGTNPRVPQ